MMGYSHGTFWTNKLVYERLVPIISALGRMPSANELRADGKNDLACAISRRGGFKSWAQRMGAGQKGTETHRGQEVEESEQSRLESLGFTVLRQTCKAPFDLLVNGHRVDVKSAHAGLYGDARDQNTYWIFALAKVKPTCDFYLLVCLNSDDSVARRYVVPSSSAKIRTLTITPCGKYEGFRDRDDLLR